MTYGFSCEFLTLGNRWKYQMLDDYMISVKADGIQALVNVNLTFMSITRTGDLLIKKGYAWDGASGPAINTPNFMRGSAVHDALYQLIRGKWLPMSARKKADKVLRRVVREDGMNMIRAWYVYMAVRLTGGKAV